MEYITCSKLDNILQRPTGRAAPPCALRPKGNEPHLEGESTYRTLRGNSFMFESMGFVCFVFSFCAALVSRGDRTSNTDSSVSPSRRERGWARPGQSSILWLLFQAEAFPAPESTCRPMRRECMHLSIPRACPALQTFKLLFFYPDHTEPRG